MDTTATDVGSQAVTNPECAPSFQVDLEAQQPLPQRKTSTSSVRSLDATVHDVPHSNLLQAADKPGTDFDAKEPALTSSGMGGTAVLQRTVSTSQGQEALLALPPPPSYDVVVDNLSIAVPPFRAYIPTPIPIPIPQAVTSAVRRWTSKGAENVMPHADARDGLIVRNVNAVVRRGEVMAIIGGSGSGKTTLLHAIAARLGNLPIAEGHVSIMPSAGGACSSGTQPKGGEGHFKGMSKVVGFVRQNDYLLPHLTGP